MHLTKEILLFTDGGSFDDELPKKENEDEKKDEEKDPEDEVRRKYLSISSFRFFNDKKELVHKNLTYRRGSNQFAEINAIANALEHTWLYVEGGVLKNVNIKLYTDSMLCYMSLTKWIYNWIRTAKKGVFISSTKQPVMHQEEFKRAFKFLTKIRNAGHTVSFFHINSHIAKKNVDDLKKKFEKFNKVKLTKDQFLFIYLQNALCDKAIQEGYGVYVKSKKPQNSMLDRLKEEI